MSSPKPSRQEQAAAWFAAQRAGAMLVEQREAFDLWRTDPRNQAALDRMHELWGELAVLKLSGPAPRKASPFPRRAIAAAALLVAVIGGTLGWLALPRDPIIETVAGQQKSQSLPDGSLVAVNVASELSYSIRDDARVVKMGDGEAAFAVKADPQKPFVVQAGDFEVRAVGTAFNVRRRDGLIEVAVSEGKVQICSGSGPDAGAVLATLSAGQLVRFPDAYTPGQFAVVPATVPTEQISEWRMRVVTYENATVREVIEDFNRYFENQRLIAKGNLLQRRVTIRLQVEDRESAIETLAALLGVGVARSPEGEVLSD